MSSGLDLREKALACGLLPRILERLSVISGEKPRVWEEVEAAAIVDDKVEETKDTKETEQVKKDPVKNTEKAKRKGTGYSSK